MIIFVAETMLFSENEYEEIITQFVERFPPQIAINEMSRNYLFATLDGRFLVTEEMSQVILVRFNVANPCVWFRKIIYCTKSDVQIKHVM